MKQFHVFFKILFSILCSGCLFLSSTTVFTKAVCHGHLINPFTDICWNCLFPISIGTVKISDHSLPDTSNSHSLFCVCHYNPLPEIGVTMGYWEPMGLVDITRTPYCLVNLGGTSLGYSVHEGTVEANTSIENTAFYDVHYFNFPVLGWVAGWLLNGTCQTDGAFLAPAYFSELDPTWRDEQLALLLFPESRSFQNPVTALAAEAACATDAVAANVGLPLDNPAWCAGSQGLMYPLTGRVAERVSSAQSGTLLSERAMYKLHRLLWIPDTSASDSCHDYHTLWLPKSRYRYQMAYPNTAPCEPFGRSTLFWDANKMNVLHSDEMGFVIWRKRNCCAD